MGSHPLARDGRGAGGGEVILDLICAFIAICVIAVMIATGVKDVVYGHDKEVSKNMGRYNQTTGEFEGAVRCNEPVWEKGK